MPILPPRYQCDFCDEIQEAKLGGDHWSHMQAKGWRHAGFDSNTKLSCPAGACHIKLAHFKEKYEAWHKEFARVQKTLMTRAAHEARNELDDWVADNPRP